MSLLSKFVRLLQSWRQRSNGHRDRSRRTGVTMEQLDHRQLLSVNFTGNVATDFPRALSPGVVVVENDPGTRFPQFPSDAAGQQLKDLVKVSGFAINGLRVSYVAANDTLSVGIQQPDNQKTGQPVIAGDADNNRNSATTDPAVLAIKPTFIDEADLGGSESMAAFLDITGDGIPDIVAGVPPVGLDPTGPKPFQVADAVPNPINPSQLIPDFGTSRPGNTGTSFLVNNPASGAFEFAITNFSKLYTEKTGQPLTGQRVIAIGAYGTSDTDDGISEAFYPANQPFKIGDATIPPVMPPVCPPVSPPITVNPHENHHIDTVHDTLIRVTVYGSSGFNVRNIIPSTVRFGGAAPAFSFIRRVNADQFPDRTFVFRGPDVDLPPGYTRATITGELKNQPAGAPDMFQSSARVFNLGPECYSQAEVDAAARRQAQRDANGTRPVPVPGLSSFPLGEVPPCAAKVAPKRVGPKFIPLSQASHSTTNMGHKSMPVVTATPATVQTNSRRSSPQAPRFRPPTVAALRQQEAMQAGLLISRPGAS